MGRRQARMPNDHHEIRIHHDRLAPPEFADTLGDLGHGTRVVARVALVGLNPIDRNLLHLHRTPPRIRKGARSAFSSYGEAAPRPASHGEAKRDLRVFIIARTPRSANPHGPLPPQYLNFYRAQDVQDRWWGSFRDLIAGLKHVTGNRVRVALVIDNEVTVRAGHQPLAGVHRERTMHAGRMHRPHCPVMAEDARCVQSRAVELFHGGQGDRDCATQNPRSGGVGSYHHAPRILSSRRSMSLVFRATTPTTLFMRASISRFAASSSPSLTTRANCAFISAISSRYAAFSA